MNILVTGGAGYIGSHTCIALIEAGHTVIVADNLCNSKAETIDRIKEITNKEVIFYNIDVTDEAPVDTIFVNHQIDGVIHFAGLKAVGESVEKPVAYYNNNLVSTMVLSKICKKYHVKKFIFSSSATVYGDNTVPFVETMELLPTTNPYGETKAMSERILTDIVKVNPDWSVALLRYFNPVGAHKSGLIGEAPNDIPNNLMPYVAQVAKGKLKKLKVFGNDYQTVDGTGVRDYIHVMDLAEGHVAALDKLTSGVHIYNLGTGEGTSVLQLVKVFEEANGIEIPYEIVDRRVGDIDSCYADASKAKRQLGWTARRGIVEMCRDSWRFEKNYIDQGGQAMKVRKAIIPAAGLGTRFLPATKAQPKEMLPIVDKPTLQYIIEEAVESGIEEILIITGRNKKSIEDHFDKSVELELVLEEKGKKELLDIVKNISNMINIHYIRQKEPKGLGHAISCAKHFIGDEPFAVMLGDDIVDSDTPCLKQLIDAYKEYRTTILGVQEVAKENTNKYGIVGGKHIEDRVYKVKDLVEKPDPDEAPSNIAILGRYIITPSIFEILENLPAGKGGEIQLTDGLKELSKKEAMYAYNFEGRRYDVGDKLGFLEATVDFALKRENLRDEFLKYLLNITEKETKNIVFDEVAVSEDLI